jgi:hypothetical protein
MKQPGEAPYARLEQQRGGRARTSQPIKYYNSTNIYYININTDDNNCNNKEEVEHASYCNAYRWMLLTEEETDVPWGAAAGAE